MARFKKQEITRRTVTAQRNSDAPNLRVQADLDSSRGYSAMGSVASDVFGRLGAAASRLQTDRAVRKDAEDQTQGQTDRTVESLSGTAAQPAETLADKTAGYRRGYYLTEAANRIHTTKLELAKATAGLRPGEDIAPIMQERMAEMLKSPEFQDAAILKEMQPAIQKMQEGVVEFRQKTELAEIFDSQAENLRQIARDGVQDGSLLTAEGVNNFRAALNTEAFAYLDDDDADDILSGAYIDLIETGQIDPENAKAALQKPIGSAKAALWDRAGWGEKFETAVSAGSTVRARKFEEAQAEMLSGMEFQLQGRASKGQLAIGDINALADKVGMHGKDRLSFVRRWIDQNDAGLKHMQSEANRAKEHKQVIAAINAGNALSLTDSQLNKSAEKEWAAAVTGGDRKVQQAVIERYTRAGIVIPQLKDMLGRTTSRNLTANYNLYAELVKIDPIAADRYLSESNATLFAQHHDNVSKFGMTPEESIQALPTGATKGRRVDVAREIGQATTQFYKDRPTLPNGSERTREVKAQIEQRAIRLALANPNASPEDNLAVAERRVLGDLIEVNGRMVPRGGARPSAQPGIDAFVREGADDLAKTGVISQELKAGVYAAPLPDQPNRFALMLPSGYPVAHPKTGRPITFDPLEVAQARAEYDSERKEAEVRASAKFKQQVGAERAGLTPWYDGKRGPSLMTTDEIEAFNNRSKPITEDGKEFPSFMNFLQEHRTARKSKGQ
ncbi:hypothetical protein [Lysobacter capsici]|uniref:hypothetical protein n=1 Tax=Lysobacter capsici TaxID=435897 RepID=UPI001C001566|nr:hypothetical protein [Lysobacter capsici]QWF18696.1 hypothetical protein KME82_08125 [Lysobacter capsici]